MTTEEEEEEEAYFKWPIIDIVDDIHNKSYRSVDTLKGNLKKDVTDLFNAWDATLNEITLIVSSIVKKKKKRGKKVSKKVKRALAYSPNIQPDSLAVFPWAITALHIIIAENRDPKQKLLNQLMLDYPNIPYSELSKIKAPVMIMSGDRDVIRPEHILKMFQSIPNSQLSILTGATHRDAWEKKDLFLRIMNDFFNKPFKMPDTKNWFVQ